MKPVNFAFEFQGISEFRPRIWLLQTPHKSFLKSDWHPSSELVMLKKKKKRSAAIRYKIVLFHRQKIFSCSYCVSSIRIFARWQHLLINESRTPVESSDCIQKQLSFHHYWINLCNYLVVHEWERCFLFFSFPCPLILLGDYNVIVKV